MITSVAAAAPTTAKESTGRSVTRVHSRDPSASAVEEPRVFRRRLSLQRSRTFLHRPVIAYQTITRRAVLDTQRDSLARCLTYRIERANESLGPARLAWLSPFAIERQRHRKARPLADPAPDGKIASMQPHQTLDDGKAQSGTAVAAVVGRLCLEIWLADPGQIFFADADTVVFDDKSHPCRFGARADCDLAAAIGEPDRVRYQVQQNLIEGTLVSNDLRQIV